MTGVDIAADDGSTEPVMIMADLDEEGLCFVVRQMSHTLILTQDQVHKMFIFAEGFENG